MVEPDQLREGHQRNNDARDPRPDVGELRAASFGENYGYVNYGANRNGSLPYLVTPNGRPTQFRFYYQLSL